MLTFRSKKQQEILIETSSQNKFPIEITNYEDDENPLQSKLYLEFNKSKSNAEEDMIDIPKSIDSQPKHKE